MTMKNGGPAFPMVTVIAPQPGHFASAPEPHSGMDLRDYFAAKAMQAEIITSFSDATPEAAEAFAAGAEAAGHTPEEHVAFIAYRIAAAMIAERDKSDQAASR